MKNALLLVLLTYWFSHPVNSQPSGQSPNENKNSSQAKAPGSQVNPFFVQQEKSTNERKGDEDRDKREINNLDIQGKSLDVSKKALKANEDTVV